ncbi:MAG: pilus assembly protein [Caulobacterales bacterium]|nr:pilus assembly protein [Caulobacterales bacterium]
MKKLKFNKKLLHLNSRGASAVEFALIAPIMIIMLFGATELSQGVSVDRKVTQAASTVADLVAQYEEVDCPTLNAIFAVTRSVFQPFSNEANAASISVASVALNGGAAKVEWSRTVDNLGNCTTSTSLPIGMTIAIPNLTTGGSTGLVNTNRAVVMGVIDLNYTSLGTSFFPSTFNMREEYFLNPRMSNKVCLDGVSTPGC